MCMCSVLYIDDVCYVLHFAAPHFVLIPTTIRSFWEAGVVDCPSLGSALADWLLLRVLDIHYRELD